MSVRCKDPARHSKWGEWADDGNVGWCRLCSPQDEPRTPAPDVEERPESAVEADTRVDTGSTDEEALRGVYGERRER